MTVKSNYALQLLYLVIGLKNLAPDFQPTRNKTKGILYARLFSHFDQVTGNC